MGEALIVGALADWVRAAQDGADAVHASFDWQASVAASPPPVGSATHAGSRAGPLEASMAGAGFFDEAFRTQPAQQSRFPVRSPPARSSSSYSGAAPSHTGVPRSNFA